ncbi:hypothetical protein GCM10027447_36680 [Glycomyces halotolerans]
MIRKALKGTLAAAAGIALGLGAGGAAQAQDDDAPPVASGDVVIEDGIQLHGATGNQSPEAAMLGLRLSEDNVRTVYCIQIHVDLLSSYVHQESAWEDTKVDNLPKVLGVLLNGYNGSNADAVMEAAGLTAGEIEGYSPDQIAYAGTQAAVWSLTDDWQIRTGDATGGGADLDTAVETIQTHLVTNAPPAEEPAPPAFTHDDSEAVVDGSTVGPFTVQTNIDSVTFQQPEGATIVDESGEALSEFIDGQTFYVEFEEAEPATVSIVTDTVVWSTPVGRAFVPVDDAGETVTGQNLILGEAHPQEFSTPLTFELVVEEAPASESPSPKPQLQTTGASTATVAGVGAAVLVAGVVAIVLMRRRAAAAGGDWGSEEQ